MAIDENIAELRRLGDELMEADFGYPLGSNGVAPTIATTLLPTVLDRVTDNASKEQLMSFYSQCDGFSFPDVHIGYFVKPSKKLDSFDRSSEPDTLLLNEPFAVLPIGSTGGGDLFVLDCQAGAVLLLPPGPLHDGQYDATGLEIREVASSIEQFVKRLTADVSAFVKGVEHRYLA